MSSSAAKKPKKTAVEAGTSSEAGSSATKKKRPMPAPGEVPEESTMQSPPKRATIRKPETQAKPEMQAIDAQLNTILQKFYLDTLYELEVRIGIDAASGKSKMDYTTFGRIFQYLNRHYTSADVFPTIELDISVKHQQQDYRVTIIGQEYVDLFSTVEAMNLDIIDRNYRRVIRKTVDSTSVINNADYEYKVKLSKEEPIETSIPLNAVRFYRFKKRYSFHTQMPEKEVPTFRLDLTIVKNYSPDMAEQVTTYEFELEFLHCTPRNQVTDTATFHRILDEFIILYQDTGFKYSVTELDKVRNEIIRLSPKRGELREATFIGAKPSSFTKENVSSIDPVGQKYSVTIKADGERYVLFIFNNEMYLVSANFKVVPLQKRIESGDILDEYKNNMNGSMVDGEYIRQTNQFLIFDIFYYGSKDVRSHVLYSRRTGSEIQTQTRYNFMLKFENYLKSKQLKTLGTSHATELPFSIQLKQYIFYDDFQDNQKYYEGSLKIFNEPYEYSIDGLIFTPCDKPYPMYGGTFMETIKWKPERENTIDFLVEFTERRKTIANVTYVVAQLFVSAGRGEKIAFQPDLSYSEYTNTEVQYMYIPIIHQKMKSNDGIEIRDKTIIECCWSDLVEFYKPNISKGVFVKGWCPYRQRIDKTAKYYESGKIAGTANSVHVANDIWSSILKPITLESVFRIREKQTETYKEVNHNYKICEHMINTVRKNLYMQYADRAAIDFSSNPLVFHYDLFSAAAPRFPMYLSVMSGDYIDVYREMNEKILLQKEKEFSVAKFNISEKVLFQSSGKTKETYWDASNNLKYKEFSRYFEAIYSLKDRVFATSFLSVGKYFKSKDHLYMTMWNISNALCVGSEWVLFFMNGSRVEKLLERENRYVFQANQQAFFEIEKKYGYGTTKFEKLITVKHGDSNEYHSEYLFYPDVLYSMLNEFGFSDPVPFELYSLLENKPATAGGTIESIGESVGSFLKKSAHSDFKLFFELFDAVRITKVRDIQSKNSVHINNISGKIIFTEKKGVENESMNLDSSGAGASTGFTPTTASTGFTPTTASTGFTPTTASTGFTPTTASTGFTPTTASTGFTPTTASTGLTPATASTGFTPTTASTGLTPATSSTGFTPATASMDFTPATASMDFTPTTASMDFTPATASTGKPLKTTMVKKRPPKK
jgi:hypothetical protein